MEDERTVAVDLIRETFACEASNLRGTIQALNVKSEADEEEKTSLTLQVQVLSDQLQTAKEQASSLEGVLDQKQQTLYLWTALMASQNDLVLRMRDELEVRLWYPCVRVCAGRGD